MWLRGHFQFYHFKMKSQFIEQVQLLMDVQQIKNAEYLFGKSNYMWLCTKRTTVVWMSTRHEFKMRQALTKLSTEQQVQVMKQLLTWLDDNPTINSLKIPEVTLDLLDKTISMNVVNEVTFSRINSFRSSLRRFSSMNNRTRNSTHLKIPVGNEKPRRSVTFNDVPIVYKISK